MSNEVPQIVTLGPLFDARQCVRYWFTKKNYGILEARGSRIDLGGQLRLDYKEWLQQYKIQNPDRFRAKGLSLQELEDALREYLNLYEADYRKTIVNGLAYKQSESYLLEKFMTALTGEANSLNVAVLKHWMWQVKRRANSLTSNYPLMPVFVGKQLGGKSMALNKLLAPWDEFRLNLKMNQLSDERYYSGFNTNFVGLFDELQGIERVDLNALKNQITTDKNTYREMRTTTLITTPMRCSFLGASNKSINENFSDSTGMRRFFELKVLPTLDWEVINGLDFTALWKSIDESLTNGYMTKEVLAELRVVQAETVVQEDVETFITEMGLRYEGEDFRTINTIETYQAYRDWCVSAGVSKPMPRRWLTLKLKNLDIPNFEKKDLKGNKQYFFQVNIDCNIGKRGTNTAQKVLDFKKPEDAI